MNKINYFLLIVMSLLLFPACGDDSAGNPGFGDLEIPAIYVDWEQNMALDPGDTIRISPQVSPSDGANYTWLFGGEVISTSMELEYEVTDWGEYPLQFIVERNGVTNNRIANVLVMKPFEEKTYNKKSIAYLSVEGSVADVSWSNITHLIVTSAKIQANGLPDFTFGGSEIDMNTLITNAHYNSVYVLMEYSGALDSYLYGATTYGSYDFYNAITDPGHRTELIHTMIDYAVTNGFDGININMDKHTEDVSFDNVAALKAFYEEMAESVPRETDIGQFFLSMSLPSGWTKAAMDEVAATPGYDWVTIQAFNATDLVSTPHSPVWLARDDMDYWVGKGVSPDKIVLGIPAFGIKYAADLTGIGWGNWGSYTQYMSYQTICNLYPDASDANHIVDNGDIYYDGLPAIQEKAEIVLSNGYAGMALWTLDNDSKDSGRSLIRKINSALGN